MIMTLRTSPLRLLLALAVLVVAPLACNDSTGNDEPEVPAEVQRLSGDGQQAIAGAELANPVVVRVLDSDGNPISGQLVNFRVTSGGGSVFSGSALTNANGEAQERWTLGTSTAAAQRLEARAVDQASGAAIVFATFEATALAGPPQRVEAVSGAAVEGTAGQALGTAIAVRVFDQHDNPVPGVAVTWSASAGGSAIPASATTDAAGRASATWTLGTQAGAQAATATVAELPAVTFSVAARAGAPATLEIVSGGGQAATVGTALGAPLTVRAKDVHGNVVVASTVEWAVVAGSGTVGSPQTATGGDGTASNTLTLGTVAGEVRVRASAGAAAPAEFVLSATAGAAHRVEIIDGGAQEGVVGQPLTRALTGVVRDQYGNPVAGMTITWSTPDGGSFNPASSVSGTNGGVSTVWTLGPTTGAQTARAGAPGLQDGSTTATARAGVATALVILGGNGQSATVETILAAPLTVRVTDAYGNAVAATAVQWTVGSGAGTLGAAQTASGPDGVASNTLELGTTAGEVRVSAALSSGASVEFSLHATGGAADRIEIVSGNNQTGVVGSYLPAPLVVRVFDQHGNPAPGATVRWEGPGQFNPQVKVTDAAGLASTRWSLGLMVEVQSATARVGTTLPAVTFTATATPGTAAEVDIQSGNGQSGTVGQPLSKPLVVVVRDSKGNRVPGTTVTFTIPFGTGTLSPQQAITDASGLATTTLTLGTVAGQVRVGFQIPGVVTTALFDATAVAGPLAQLIPVTLDQARYPIETATLQVRAADQYGNAIFGVWVDWAVLSGNGGVTPPRSLSNVSGVAETLWWHVASSAGSIHTIRASAGTIVSPVLTVRVVHHTAWRQVMLPTSAPLRDIWGTSANNIYAVGDGGTVVHFNGTSWQQVDVGTTANLTEVVGTGPSDVRVTGSGQRIHFNGSSWGAVTWSALPSYGYDGPCCGPGSGPQPQIARSAENHAFAIVPGSLNFGRDTVKHWNGSVWSTVFVLGASERAAVLWIAPDGRAMIGLSGIASGYYYDGLAWRSGLGGGRVMSYKGKAFTDVFITMNFGGGCCYFSHSNGTVRDYNGSGSFNGEPLWFISPTEIYYRDGTGVRRLSSTEQFVGAGTAEGVNGTVMWGTSSTNLYLIGLDGTLWRKSP